MLLPIILTLLCQSLAVPSSNRLRGSTVIEANYGETYSNKTNSTLEYIYQFSNQNKTIRFRGPPRVTVTLNATPDMPLMVTSRQPQELLSWKVPLAVEQADDHLAVEEIDGQQSYMKTSRTLCFDIFNEETMAEYKDLQHVNPIVTLATTSERNIYFNVSVDFQEYFQLNHSQDYHIVISSSEPQYFFYNFSKPDDANVGIAASSYDSVMIELTSDDKSCTVVSIQNVSCPVFDLNTDITFRGFYETFTTKGGITVPKGKFPYGFYIVFVVKENDYDCTREVTSPGEIISRNKKVTINIKSSLSFSDYIFAVFMTLIAIGAFYVVFGLSFFIFSKKYLVPRQMQYATENNETENNLFRDSLNPCGVVTVSEQIESEVTDESAGATGTDANLDSQSLDEHDYDHLHDISSDREVRLLGSALTLKDTARKPPRVLAKKSYLYLYNVLTVALFYGLPVVQLVIQYQRVLNETGEQDLCYYNFLCAHPLGFLSDFNHVFSNTGYALLGILFLMITYHRECTHEDQDFDRNYGIPQHYGLFYALGVALIMEGVLSGSYHVCPNQTNFQFDSSFMYVMAVLCMIKLYQNRHPDINANAYSTFGVLAVAILLGMIGILKNSNAFLICFIIVHIFACFYLSIKVYYMGCFNLNMVSVKRLGHVLRHDFRAGPINVLKPCYTARFVMLIVGNLCNWGLGIYALVLPPRNFAFFLLLIFMANTMLYFLFYIVMKYLHKERVKIVTWIFLTISFGCAAVAMYCFLQKSTSWSKTPAESRTFNMKCKVLNFYDFHDIWHFLSAIGMFFLFMVLLTLDDDLSHTNHALINVF